MMDDIDELLDQISHATRHQDIESLEAEHLRDSETIQRLLESPLEETEAGEQIRDLDALRTEVSSYRDEQVNWLAPILASVLEDGVAEQPYEEVRDQLRPVGLLSVGPNGMELYQDLGQDDLELVEDTEDQRATGSWMYNYTKQGDEFLTHVNLDYDDVTLNDSFVAGTYALMQSSELSMSDVRAEGRDVLKRSEDLSLRDCYLEAEHLLKESEEVVMEDTVAIGEDTFQHYDEVEVRDSFIVGEQPFRFHSNGDGRVEIYNSVIVGDSVFEGVEDESELVLYNSIIAADEIASDHVVMNDSYHVTSEMVHRYDTGTSLGSFTPSDDPAEPEESWTIDQY